jgi:transcriptional regulator with XRE-family HTH domain
MIDLIGKRILQLLESKNMSQRDLAEKTGVQEATISRYVNGHRNPQSEILSKIAQALNTTSDYLLTGKDFSEWANQLQDATEKRKLDLLPLKNFYKEFDSLPLSKQVEVIEKLKSLTRKKLDEQ